ncbi:MAG TPA: hypothetical protein VGM88_33130 [Kofleriaceae bacterium]|jgi:hypothetical protein
MRSWLCAIAVVVVAAGCGGEDEDVGAELQAIPGVTASEWTPPSGVEPEAGYRYFDLTFEEPVDHEDPGAGTFEVKAELMHRDSAAPLVVVVNGYDVSWGRNLSEPAALVAGNQISIEYRFYGESKPAGGVPWPKLRVSQWSEDQHDIVQKLESIYTGARIATGGSKGGENALQQMQLHPEDYAGAVAYVPPVITAFPDERYEGILDRIGIDSCRQALRAVARQLLVRRLRMQPLVAASGTFEVVGVAHAFETAAVELEFSFWMTRGIHDCVDVPDAMAADNDLYAFLVGTSPPTGYDDDTLATSGTQYLYQDYIELGYPVLDHAYLDDLLQYSYEDWSDYLPPGEPHAYDPAMAQSLADWVTNDSQHVLLVGGEWDPWSAGYPPVAPGRDAYELIVPEASHWSTSIYALPQADRDSAVGALAKWAGVPFGEDRIRPPHAPMAAPERRWR